MFSPYAGEQFGARETDQDAAPVAEVGFGGGDLGLDVEQLGERALGADLYVHQQLRIDPAVARFSQISFGPGTISFGPGTMWATGNRPVAS